MNCYGRRVFDGYAQAFFLHIPKTGGLSFQAVLRDAVGEAGVRPIPHGPEMLSALRSGPDAPVVYGHVPYTARRFLREPVFVMTLLREPVDRAISGFEWIATRPNQEEMGRAARERWKRKGIDRPELASPNLQTAMLGADRQPGQPQRPDRDSLERAKRRLRGMEFFGITERMDESLSLLGIEAPAPRKNVAPGHDTYDRDSVAEANRLDVELYDFAMRLFHERFEDLLLEGLHIDARMEAEPYLGMNR